LQEQVEAALGKIRPSLCDWSSLGPQERASLFHSLRSDGSHNVKYLNTVLVILSRILKAVLAVMKDKGSPFWAPLGTCLELECRGATDSDFLLLDQLQEKFISYHAQRGLTITAMMFLFQLPPQHHVFRNDEALKKVSSL
jgi:hypothetical protein